MHEDQRWAKTAQDSSKTPLKRTRNSFKQAQTSLRQPDIVHDNDTPRQTQYKSLRPTSKGPEMFLLTFVSDKAFVPQSPRFVFRSGGLPGGTRGARGPGGGEPQKAIEKPMSTVPKPPKSLIYYHGEIRQQQAMGNPQLCQRERLAMHESKKIGACWKSLPRERQILLCRGLHVLRPPVIAV